VSAAAWFRLLRCAEVDLDEGRVLAWLGANGYGKRRPKATAETVHNHAAVAAALRQLGAADLVHERQGRKKQLPTF